MCEAHLGTEAWSRLKIKAMTGEWEGELEKFLEDE